MSQFNDLMKMIEVVDGCSNNDPVSVESVQSDTSVKSSYEILPKINKIYEPFNIDKFNSELYKKSAIKNQLYREVTQNVNAYDLASGCIRDIIYKLTNTPVESFADKWLPILMRSVIGTAIHEFIQDNTEQFTEREVSLKIPSIRFSGRLDNLIGPNILVEIKSCPYSDYSRIISTRKPRVNDFYQTMVYKYILENYLEEAKDPLIEVRQGTEKPKLDSYNIQTIQYIYVAHDITATDVGNFSEALQRIKDIKKLLNSKSNSFFFMTTMTVDVTNGISDPYIEFVKNKLAAIRHYMDTNTFPDNDDPYIDKKACFFCLYKKLCNV